LASYFLLAFRTHVAVSVVEVEFCLVAFRVAGVISDVGRYTRLDAVEANPHVALRAHYAITVVEIEF